MLKDQALAKKLQDLRAYYQNPIDQRAISELENKLRTSIVEAGLKEVEPVPQIIEDAYNQIRQINFLLVFDEDLLKAERSDFRTALVRERAAHQFWLERLGAWSADRVIEEIDRFATERLKPSNPQS